MATLWDNSNDKDKVSSTSKERVENRGNNVDIDDRHTEGHAGNVEIRYTDTHADTHTWSNVFRIGTIRRRNMRICTTRPA